MGHARLLLVEDEDSVARAYAGYLMVFGFEVDVASTGEEALQLAVETRPDLIVLDIHLPGISGFDVLAATKRSAALSDIPVVILSNDPDPGLEADCRHLGVVDYLTKATTTPSTFMRHIRRWLSAPEVARTRAETLRTEGSG